MNRLLNRSFNFLGALGKQFFGCRQINIRLHIAALDPKLIEGCNLPSDLRCASQRSVRGCRDRNVRKKELIAFCVETYPHPFNVAEAKTKSNVRGGFKGYLCIGKRIAMIFSPITPPREIIPTTAVGFTGARRAESAAG